MMVVVPGGVVSVIAYVLIQAEVGKAAEVAQGIARIQGVISAENVAGPYDVIAEAEAADMNALGEMVVSSVQLVDGVTRTLTCPVIKL
jgi:DNA-binding Lrp family transcriptional regulator